MLFIIILWSKQAGVFILSWTHKGQSVSKEHFLNFPPRNCCCLSLFLVWQAALDVLSPTGIWKDLWLIPAEDTRIHSGIPWSAHRTLPVWIVFRSALMPKQEPIFKCPRVKGMPRSIRLASLKAVNLHTVTSIEYWYIAMSLWSASSTQMRCDLATARLLEKSWRGLCCQSAKWQGAQRLEQILLLWSMCSEIMSAYYPSFCKDPSLNGPKALPPNLPATTLHSPFGSLAHSSSSVQLWPVRESQLQESWLPSDGLPLCPQCLECLAIGWYLENTFSWVNEWISEQTKFWQTLYSLREHFQRLVNNSSFGPPSIVKTSHWIRLMDSPVTPSPRILSSIHGAVHVSP